MNMFIDKSSWRAYLPVTDGDDLTAQRHGPDVLKRQDKETNRTTKEKPMSSLRNFAVQAAVTLTLSAALAALLYNVAEFATRGVIV